MRAEETAVAGVKLLTMDHVNDERGAFSRLFCKEGLAEAGIAFEVVQASLSSNPAVRTLRGLHLQSPPQEEAKIVSCLRGRIFDVALDMRPESSTYLRWAGEELSEGSGRALYLPRGIAHGFLTLEPDSIVHYLMDAPFVPEAATGFRWDDPAIAIDWPAEPELMSERDRSFDLIAP